MAQKDPNSTWGAVSRAAGIGIQMAACVAVGLFAGKTLDRWLESSPWGAVGGIVCGMLAGLWSVLRMVRDEE